MAVEIEPYGGEVSEQKLAEIEQVIGYTLPDDYRRWLKATNGGAPRDGATLPDAPVHLGGFVLAVDDRGDSPLLYTRRTNEYLTDEFLQLNYARSGILALKLSDPDRGSVWYLSGSDMGYEYDYEDEGYDSEPAYICAALLERVADSFDDLLDRLVPAPPLPDGGHGESEVSDRD